MIANVNTRLRRRSHSGFTLVELLVVIAIIGILIALLLPAVQAAREAARRSQCSNNMKQLGLALHNYHDVYNVLPPGGMRDVSTTILANGLAWNVLILPFMEQQPLYDQFNFLLTPDNSCAGAPNTTIARTPVAGFLCPSGTKLYDGASTTIHTAHYVGIMGPKGTNPVTNTAYSVQNGTGYSGHGGFARDGTMYYNSEVKFRDILDGTANTLLVGELSHDKANCYRLWPRGIYDNHSRSTKNITYSINAFAYGATTTTIYPSMPEFNDVSMSSNHPGGAQFTIADGSTRFLSETVDITLYRSAASRNGGESKTAIE